MKSELKIGVASVVGVVLCATAFSSLYTIDSGERGLVLRFGEAKYIQTEGLHVKAPFIDDVIKVDVRTLKADVPTEAGTKDLQRVSTEVVVNYHLKPEKISDIYTKVGFDLSDKIISPRIKEVVKAVTAKYNAEELIVKREDVKFNIQNQLKEQLSQYNLELEGVQITDFKFSKSFDDSIEAKQIAEQSALTAENNLRRIEIEAEQKVTMAKAEAETIKIQTQAIKEQGGAEYVQLKAIEKWDGKLPYFNGDKAMPMINLK